MTRNSSRMAACLLAVCLGGWGAPLGAEDVGICDDFEDGNVLDGDPVCWTTFPGFPAIYEVADGDLRIRNAQIGAYGVLRTCDTFTGDVSIRASARLEDPAGTGELELLVHCDGAAGYGYVAELRSWGEVCLIRADSGGTQFIGLAQIPGFAPGNEYIFDLTVRGDRVEVRVWEPGAFIPTPLVSVMDTKYRTGFAGLLAYSPELGSSFRAVYHDVCIFSMPTDSDCNENGFPDHDDMASGRSQDCNTNDIPDECDIAAARSHDCNANDVPDECDIAQGTSPDSNSNGVPDACDAADGLVEDCDDFEDGDVFDGDPVCWTTFPGFPAIYEVADGDLRIRNTQIGAYGVLRTCDTFSDDISIRASARLDDPAGTGELDLVVHLDSSGSSGYVAELRSWGEVCLIRAQGGVLRSLAIASIPGFALGKEYFFALTVRGERVEVSVWEPGAPRGPIVSVIDAGPRSGFAAVCAYSPDLGSSFRAVFHSVCVPAQDCNENGFSDHDEIAAGRSQDCNANDKPDECDIAQGTSADCNTNRVPDECDLASGRSYDCNGTGVPDDCEVSPFPARLLENTTGIPDATFLGPPDKGYEGIGSASVTYDFYPAEIVDGPGVDFSVYEGALPVEFDLIDVLLSADGRNFTSVKTSEALLVRVPGDKAHTFSGLGRSYDLEGSGHEAVRYVRIQGTSAEPAGEGRGFDLDAVGAIHLRLCQVKVPYFRRGDANDDGAVDISDAVFTLNWLFLGGKAPGCEASADTNGDKGTDISDPVYLLGYLFLGRPPPEPPFPECGPGSLPTDETLECATAPESCSQP